MSSSSVLTLVCVALLLVVDARFHKSSATHVNPDGAVLSFQHSGQLRWNVVLLTEFEGTSVACESNGDMILHVGPHLLDPTEKILVLSPEQHNCYEEEHRPLYLDVYGVDRLFGGAHFRLRAEHVDVDYIYNDLETHYTFWPANHIDNPHHLARKRYEEEARRNGEEVSNKRNLIFFNCMFFPCDIDWSPTETIGWNWDDENKTAIEGEKVLWEYPDAESKNARALAREEDDGEWETSVNASLTCVDCYAYVTFGFQFKLQTTRKMFGLPKCKYLLFKVFGGVGVNIQLELKASISAELKKVIDLFSTKLPGIEFMAGPVPVWIKPNTFGVEATVQPNLEASVRATTGAWYNWTASWGIEYKDSNWNYIQENNQDYGIYYPQIFLEGKASLEVSLAPYVEFRTYSILPIRFALQPSVKVTATYAANFGKDVEQPDTPCTPLQIRLQMEWAVYFVITIEKVDFFVVQIGGPVLPYSLTATLFDWQPFPGRWGDQCLGFSNNGRRLQEPSGDFEKVYLSKKSSMHGLPACSTYTTCDACLKASYCHYCYDQEMSNSGAGTCTENDSPASCLNTTNQEGILMSDTCTRPIFFTEDLFEKDVVISIGSAIDLTWTGGGPAVSFSIGLQDSTANMIQGLFGLPDDSIANPLEFPSKFVFVPALTWGFFMPIPTIPNRYELKTEVLVQLMISDTTTSNNLNATAFQRNLDGNPPIACTTSEDCANDRPECFNGNCVNEIPWTQNQWGSSGWSACSKVCKFPGLETGKIVRTFTCYRPLEGGSEGWDIVNSPGCPSLPPGTDLERPCNEQPCVTTNVTVFPPNQTDGTSMDDALSQPNVVQNGTSAYIEFLVGEHVPVFWSGGYPYQSYDIYYAEVTGDSTYNPPASDWICARPADGPTPTPRGYGGCGQAYRNTNGINNTFYWDTAEVTPGLYNVKVQFYDENNVQHVFRLNVGLLIWEMANYDVGLDPLVNTYSLYGKFGQTVENQDRNRLSVPTLWSLKSIGFQLFNTPQSAIAFTVKSEVGLNKQDCEFRANKLLAILPNLVDPLPTFESISFGECCLRCSVDSRCEIFNHEQAASGLGQCVLLRLLDIATVMNSYKWSVGMRPQGEVDLVIPGQWSTTDELMPCSIAKSCGFCESMANCGWCTSLGVCLSTAPMDETLTLIPQPSATRDTSAWARLGYIAKLTTPDGHNAQCLSYANGVLPCVFEAEEQNWMQKPYINELFYLQAAEVTATGQFDTSKSLVVSTANNGCFTFGEKVFSGSGSASTILQTMSAATQMECQSKCLDDALCTQFSFQRIDPSTDPVLISKGYRCTKGNWVNMYYSASPRACMRKVLQNNDCSSDYFSWATTDGNCWCVNVNAACDTNNQVADYVVNSYTIQIVAASTTCTLHRDPLSTGPQTSQTGVAHLMTENVDCNFEDNSVRRYDLGSAVNPDLCVQLALDYSSCSDYISWQPDDGKCECYGGRPTEDCLYNKDGINLYEITSRNYASMGPQACIQGDDCFFNNMIALPTCHLHLMMGTDMTNAMRTTTYPQGLTISEESSCCAACQRDPECVAAVIAYGKGGVPDLCYPIRSYTDLVQGESYSNRAVFVAKSCTVRYPTYGIIQGSLLSETDNGMVCQDACLNTANCHAFETLDSGKICRLYSDGILAQTYDDPSLYSANTDCRGTGWYGIRDKYSCQQWCANNNYDFYILGPDNNCKCSNGCSIGTNINLAANFNIYTTGINGPKITGTCGVQGSGARYMPKRCALEDEFCSCIGTIMFGPAYDEYYLTSPPGYKYVGCYRDDPSREFTQGPMNYGYTIATCSSACATFRFFALQDQGWCSCGNERKNTAPYNQVTNDCPGNQLGGAYLNNVFTHWGDTLTFEAMTGSFNVYTKQTAPTDSTQQGSMGAYCSNSVFGGDPAFDKKKQCYCVSQALKSEVSNLPLYERGELPTSSARTCTTTGCTSSTAIKSPNLLSSWGKYGYVWSDRITYPRAYSFTNLGAFQPGAFEWYWQTTVDSRDAEYTFTVPYNAELVYLADGVSTSPWGAGSSDGWDLTCSGIPTISTSPNGYLQYYVQGVIQTMKFCASRFVRAGESVVIPATPGTPDKKLFFLRRAIAAHLFATVNMEQVNPALCLYGEPCSCTGSIFMGKAYNAPPGETGARLSFRAMMTEPFVVLIPTVDRNTCTTAYFQGQDPAPGYDKQCYCVDTAGSYTLPAPTTVYSETACMQECEDNLNCDGITMTNGGVCMLLANDDVRDDVDNFVGLREYSSGAVSKPRNCLATKFMNYNDLETGPYNVNTNPGLWSAERPTNLAATFSRLRSRLFNDYCLAISGHRLGHLELCPPDSMMTGSQAAWSVQSAFITTQVSEVQYKVLSCPVTVGGGFPAQYCPLQCPTVIKDQQMDTLCDCSVDFTLCDLNCVCPDSSGQLIYSILRTSDCTGTPDSANQVSVSLQDSGATQCQYINSENRQLERQMTGAWKLLAVPPSVVLQQTLQRGCKTTGVCEQYRNIIAVDRQGTFSPTASPGSPTSAPGGAVDGTCWRRCGSVGWDRDLNRYSREVEKQAEGQASEEKFWGMFPAPFSFGAPYPGPAPMPPAPYGPTPYGPTPYGPPVGGGFFGGMFLPPPCNPYAWNPSNMFFCVPPPPPPPPPPFVPGPPGPYPPGPGPVQPDIQACYNVRGDDCKCSCDPRCVEAGDCCENYGAFCAL